jgi:hypothetical protein
VLHKVRTDETNSLISDLISRIYTDENEQGYSINIEWFVCVALRLVFKKSDDEIKLIGMVYGLSLVVYMGKWIEVYFIFVLLSQVHFIIYGNVRLWKG